MAKPQRAGRGGTLNCEYLHGLGGAPLESPSNARKVAGKTEGAAGFQPWTWGQIERGATGREWAGWECGTPTSEAPGGRGRGRKEHNLRGRAPQAPWGCGRSSGGKPKAEGELRQARVRTRTHTHTRTCTHGATKVPGATRSGRAVW